MLTLKKLISKTKRNYFRVTLHEIFGDIQLLKLFSFKTCEIDMKTWHICVFIDPVYCILFPNDGCCVFHKASATCGFKKKVAETSIRTSH